MAVDSKLHVTQTFRTNHNNFNLIEIRFKNTNLENKSNLKLLLKEVDGVTVLDKTINGMSINDDFNLRLNFPSNLNRAKRSMFWKFTV